MGSHFKWNSFAFVILALILMTAGSSLATAVNSPFAMQYGLAVALVGSQSCPAGIDVDAAGTIYWVNYCSGELLELRRGSAFPIAVLNGLNGPYGVGVDGAGNLYFDEYFRGVLSRLTPNSTSPEVLLRGLDFPNFMSIDASGNVYFITGQTCGDKIVRYDVTTHEVTTVLEAPQPRDVNHGFGGLFLTSRGDLYFTTCDSSTVGVLRSGSSTPINVFNVTGRPTGIAVDRAGNVYYSLYNSSIDELPRGGRSPRVLSTQGSSRLQLAIDRSGNLYYTDNVGGRIWIIPLQILTTSTVTSLSTTTVTSTASFTSTTLSTVTSFNQTTGGPPPTTVTSVAVSTLTTTATQASPSGATVTTKASTASIKETITETATYTESYASTYTENYPQPNGSPYSSLSTLVLLLVVACLSAYLFWSRVKRRPPSPVAETVPDRIGIETVDEMVLKYVRDHGGEISISGASTDLGISESKLRESLSRLTDKGALSKHD